MVNVPRYLVGLAAPYFSYLFTQTPFQDASNEAPPEKSIAIVGAGSAGLAMLHTLLTLPEHIRADWEFTLFEEREDVAGVWLPDRHNVSPPAVPESPLYPRLHTNTPVPFMTYPNFPFPAGTPLYPSHEHIQAYHNHFARHHKLHDYIQFNHTVEAAGWVGSPERGFWNLSISNSNGVVSHKQFGHLVVASGNHHIPRIPEWPGQDDWAMELSVDSKLPRKIVHSVYYRDPEVFANRTVVIVGYGSSSRDIASQIVELTRKTYISTRHSVDENPVLGLPLKNVTYKPDVSHFTSDAIFFNDGTSVEADTVVLATGYLQRKPFLERGGVLVADPTARSNASYQGVLTTNFKYIFPLYQHILSLSTQYPTNALAFIGLPTVIANCPSDVAQGLFAAYAITQPHILPSREKLLENLARYEESVRDRRLDPYTNGHRRFDLEDSSDYQDDLVQFLQDKGVYSNDNNPFVEQWRRDIGKYEFLKRGWARIEELGQRDEWTKDAHTEKEWSDVMAKVNDWERKWEEDNGVPFQVDLDFYGVS